MEKMTEKEKKVLKELQAKAKRIEREKKKIMAEADEMKEELLERWGIRQTELVEKVESEKNSVWKSICTAYGVTEDDLDGQKKLYEHLVSERQVNYYHNYR